MTKTKWPISQLLPALQTKTESPRAASLERSIRPFVISYLSLTWENVHSIKRLHEKKRLSLPPVLELGEALQVAPAQRAPSTSFVLSTAILSVQHKWQLPYRANNRENSGLKEGGGHHGEEPLQKLMSAPCLVKLTTVLRYRVSFLMIIQANGELIP